MKRVGVAVQNELKKKNVSKKPRDGEPMVGTSQSAQTRV
jgi:hypothetical protein